MNRKIAPSIDVFGGPAGIVVYVAPEYLEGFQEMVKRGMNFDFPGCTEQLHKFAEKIREFDPTSMVPSGS